MTNLNNLSSTIKKKNKHKQASKKNKSSNIIHGGAEMRSTSLDRLSGKLPGQAISNKVTQDNLYDNRYNKKTTSNTSNDIFTEIFPGLRRDQLNLNFIEFENYLVVAAKNTTSITYDAQQILKLLQVLVIEFLEDIKNKIKDKEAIEDFESFEIKYISLILKFFFKKGPASVPTVSDINNLIDKVINDGTVSELQNLQAELVRQVSNLQRQVSNLQQNQQLPPAAPPQATATAPPPQPQTQTVSINEKKALQDKINDAINNNGGKEAIAKAVIDYQQDYGKTLNSADITKINDFNDKNFEKRVIKILAVDDKLDYFYQLYDYIINPDQKKYTISQQEWEQQQVDKIKQLIQQIVSLKQKLPQNPDPGSPEADRLDNLDKLETQMWQLAGPQQIQQLILQIESLKNDWEEAEEELEKLIEQMDGVQKQQPSFYDKYEPPNLSDFKRIKEGLIAAYDDAKNIGLEEFGHGKILTNKENHKSLYLLIFGSNMPDYDLKAYYLRNYKKMDSYDPKNNLKPDYNDILDQVDRKFFPDENHSDMDLLSYSKRKSTVQIGEVERIIESIKALDKMNIQFGTSLNKNFIKQKTQSSNDIISAFVIGKKDPSDDNDNTIIISITKSDGSHSTVDMEAEEYFESLYDNNQYGGVLTGGTGKAVLAGGVMVGGATLRERLTLKETRAKAYDYLRKASNEDRHLVGILKHAGVYKLFSNIFKTIIIELIEEHSKETNADSMDNVINESFFTIIQDKLLQFLNKYYVGLYNSYNMISAQKYLDPVQYDVNKLRKVLESDSKEYTNKKDSKGKKIKRMLYESFKKFGINSNIKIEDESSIGILLKLFKNTPKVKEFHDQIMNAKNVHEVNYVLSNYLKNDIDFNSSTGELRYKLYGNKDDFQVKDVVDADYIQSLTDELAKFAKKIPKQSSGQHLKEIEDLRTAIEQLKPVSSAATVVKEDTDAEDTDAEDNDTMTSKMSPVSSAVP